MIKKIKNFSINNFNFSIEIDIEENIDMLGRSSYVIGLYNKKELIVRNNGVLKTNYYNLCLLINEFEKKAMVYSIDKISNKSSDIILKDDFDKYLNSVGFSNMIKVALIESERGWGSKVDEIKEFSTLEEANEFIEEFNSKNNEKSAPDWYMYAELLK